MIQKVGDESPPNLFKKDSFRITNMIARWKCYPNQQPGVRIMYLRSMCLLRRQENFKDFEEIAISILTLSLAISGKKGSCGYKGYEFLKEKIKGVKEDVPNEILSEPEKLEEHDLTFEKDDSNKVSSIEKWVEQLYSIVKKETDEEMILYNDEVNGYKLPALTKKVKDFLPYFPLFSEIMQN